MEFLKKLVFKTQQGEHNYPLHPVLAKSLRIIRDFFKNNHTSKLCIVYPSKKYIPQWITIPLTLDLMKKEYDFKFGELEFHKNFREGDLLKLNNNAVVEWLGCTDKKIRFRTADEGSKGGPVTFTVPFSYIEKFQPVNSDNSKLSKSANIRKIINEINTHPFDNLFGVNTGGNFPFLDKSISLVTKISTFNDSVGNLLINNYPLKDYFREVKLTERGEQNPQRPLIISKNLTVLIQYLYNFNNIEIILIDGINSILESITDYSDIVSYNIPIVLFTDLSEVENFQSLNNYSFIFYNFTETL